MPKTIYPRNIKDVQKIINNTSSKCAYDETLFFNACNLSCEINRKCILPNNVAVRSGGHSYCPLIANTIIDTSNFNSIRVDIEKNLVKVGAAVTMKELYLTLLKYGYTFPGGSCPNVAMGGIILGGGLSILMRKYSISCDNVIDATVVLSDGSIINAKDDKNLMWMLKGAGQGLFVAINFTLKIYKLPRITYDFTLKLKDWSNAPKALKIWQTFIDSTKIPIDNNLWMQLIISYKKLKILGHYHGKIKHKNFGLPRKFLHFFDVDIYPRIDYIDSLKFWFGDTPNPNLIFNAISTIQYTKFCDNGIYDLIEIFSIPQKFNISVNIDLLGGKMQVKDNTAFPHRNAFCTYQFITTSNEKYADDANIWLLNAYNKIKLYTCGSYVSYCNSYIKPKMYFLQNAKRIKDGIKTYDPTNKFYRSYDPNNELS